MKDLRKCIWFYKKKKNWNGIKMWEYYNFNLFFLVLILVLCENMFETTTNNPYTQIHILLTH